MKSMFERLACMGRAFPRSGLGKIQKSGQVKLLERWAAGEFSEL
jgi:hypothetical protein